MLVKTLKRACLGFVIGMAVGNLIAALTGHPGLVSAALLERAGSPAAALLWQTLLSGLIGFAGFAGVSYYDVERWPLLLTALVHYATFLAVYLCVAFALGWLSTAAEALLMAAIMAVIYLIIFFILCARYRAEVRKLNEMQKQQNDKEQNGGIV